METFSEMELPQQQEFFVSELAPSAIQALLGRGDELEAAEDFEMLNQVVLTYLRFVKDVAIDYDVVATYETLAAVFDTQSDLYTFSTQVDVNDEGADGPFISQQTAVQESVLFLINFNRFGEIGGFEGMFKRLEDHGESRPNLEVVHWIAHVLQKNISIMQPAMRKNFGVRMRRVIPAFLESCTLEQLQHEDNKNISGTLNQLEHALRASIGPSYRQGFFFFFFFFFPKNLFADFEISKIQLGNRLLRLGLLNKRLLGLNLICDVADGARVAARRDQLVSFFLFCFVFF